METKTFSFTSFGAGIRIIIQNALEFKRLFYAAIFLAFLFAAIDPFDTLFVGRFIDALGKTAYWSIFGWIVPSYLVLLALWFIFQIAESVVLRYQVLTGLKVGEFVRTSYISKMMGHLFRLPMDFHKSHKQGEIQDKITTASRAMLDILSDDFVTVFPQIMSMAISMIIIFTLSPYIFFFRARGHGRLRLCDRRDRPPDGAAPAQDPGHIRAGARHGYGCCD